MSDNQRIQQFEQMVAADPQNELGHFSLGKAYLDAGRFADATRSLGRAVEINAKMSKAYQLLGQAHDKSGGRQAAIEIITRGVVIADEQGDRMPRDGMIGLLREWGAPVPKLKEDQKRADAPAASAEVPAHFECSRCGRPTGQLSKPPFKGPLGAKVHAHVCQGCWREWIGMGTKVINELGLALSTPEGQEAYDQYMIEFLNLEEVG